MHFLACFFSPTPALTKGLELGIGTMTNFSVSDTHTLGAKHLMRGQKPLGLLCWYRITVSWSRAMAIRASVFIIGKYLVVKARILIPWGNWTEELGSTSQLHVLGFSLGYSQDNWELGGVRGMDREHCVLDGSSLEWILSPHTFSSPSLSFPASLKLT